MPQSKIAMLEARCEYLAKFVNDLQHMVENNCIRIVAQSELITKLIEEKRCQARTVGQSTPTPLN